MPNNLSPETKKLLDSSLMAWENQETRTALDVLENLRNKAGIEGLSEKWLKELKIRMQWVAFPALIEEEQLQLLSENILIPIHSESFDLKKALRIKYLAISADEWINSVPKMLKAMLSNEELLGSQTLSVGSNPNARSTVGNWLKDYVQMFGMDKQDEMAVRKYLTDSINAQSLSSPDKKILEELLLLFESTKMFSIKQIMDEMEKIDKQEKRLAEANAQKTKNVSQQKTSPQQQVAQQPATTQQQTPIPQAPPQPRPIQQQVPQQQIPRQARTQPTAQQAIRQQVPQQAPQQAPLKQVPVQTASSVLPKSPLPKPEVQNINFPKRLQPIPLKVQSDGSTIQKTIKQAFQTNPRVADQPITSAPISLLGRETKVAPTVQNWLFDYRSQFGATGNTEDERQEFLFKSINAKNLNTEERHRLSVIIESHDKDVPIAISKDKGVILFN